MDWIYQAKVHWEASVKNLWAPTLAGNFLTSISKGSSSLLDQYMVAQFEDVSRNTHSLYVSTPDSSNLLAQNTLT